jgi:hypothetical protein
VFDKDEPIPAFISVEAADLMVEPDGSQGAGTSAIVDAHIFANDIFVGTIELPGRVPILEEGDTRITLAAGIKNNGISSDRIIYPFYQSLVKTIDLQPGVVQPFDEDSVAVFQYFEDDGFGGLKFLFEGFEGIGNIWEPAELNGTAIVNITDTSEALSGSGCGKITLDDDFPDFEVYSQTSEWDFSDVNPGQPVYMEVDYRGNNPLEIGIRLNNETQSKIFALGLNPRENWTKVYVELTNEIGLGQSTDFQIYLETKKTTNEPQAIIYLDNLKVVYAN